MSLVLILSLFNIAQAVNHENPIQPRIIGGEIVTKREDFPYLVTNTKFCY